MPAPYPVEEYDQESGFHALAHAARFLIAQHHGITVDEADVSDVTLAGASEAAALEYMAAPGVILTAIAKGPDRFMAAGVKDGMDYWSIAHPDDEDRFEAAFADATLRALAVIQNRMPDVPNLAAAFMASGGLVNIDTAAYAIFGQDMTAPDGTIVTVELRERTPDAEPQDAAQ